MQHQTTTSLSTKAKVRQPALKEWTVAIDALTAGKTIMLLRKGGIREQQGKFQVEQRQVLLYPTYEHQKPELLKNPYADQVQPVESGWHPQTVTISSWAEITDVLPVYTGATVEKLLDFHVWNERFVYERLKWKPQQPLYVLLLRVYQLLPPLEIPYNVTYGGCKSWIEVELEPEMAIFSSQGLLNNARQKPAIADVSYSKIVTQIRDAIANPTAS